MTAEAAEPRSLLRRLYDWCIDAAHKPHAMWTMGAVSFAESSFFPVPPDVMLIPMALARPATRLCHGGLVHGQRRSQAACSATPSARCFMIGRRLADPTLRLRRQGRGLPRGLRAMGRLDHPAQGPDADSLQDRHHHLGLCRLQFRAVSSCFRSSRAAPGFSCWPSCCTAMASGRVISSKSDWAYG